MLEKPDLIFYYALRLPTTIINTNQNGTDINQSANGVIFADSKLEIPIGKFAFYINIFDAVDGIYDKEKLYQVCGTNNYFLPEGTISNLINLQFIKDSNGNFIVPHGTRNVYQVLSGSGDFLNSSGFIVQTADKDEPPFIRAREMLVYFDK